jgi:ribosomal protein S11
MRAIIRYEDAGITVPYEWIDEVCLLLDKHRTSERLTTSGNVSYQKYASKDTANASMDAMRQAIKGAKEHGGNHISFNIKDLENTLDGIQKAINHE